MATEKQTKWIEIYQSQLTNATFDPVKVDRCFLRGPLTWLATAKNKLCGNGWLEQSSHVSELRYKEIQDSKKVVHILILKCEIPQKLYSALLREVYRLRGGLIPNDISVRGRQLKPIKSRTLPVHEQTNQPNKPTSKCYGENMRGWGKIEMIVVN